MDTADDRPLPGNWPVVTMIWEDRLAEVWAAPGSAGAGVVIGVAAVLTARHLVAGAVDKGAILARVVRPGAQTAEWVRMTVIAEDADRDVALLGISNSNGGTEPLAQWLEPSSSSPVFVRLGATAEYGCVVVGFQQQAAQHASDGSPATTVRQGEHALGTLVPQEKASRRANRKGPPVRGGIAFDIEEPACGAEAGWGGMSGAGVVLPDGRLAGLVVNAEADNHRRRMCVMPFADILGESTSIAEVLPFVLDGPVVLEVSDAHLWRDVLQERCLGPDGFPVLVGEASYGAFGVKPAHAPGEPAFLDYVPRKADQELRDRLKAAQAGRRMLLVIGGGAGGKSRSAAEAARQQLPGHRLLCPKPRSLARLQNLPLADLGPTLVWLDDAENYEELAFRDTVEWLLRARATVVATIRRSEFEARAPKGGLRSPFMNALSDPELVVATSWPVMWDDLERERVSAHVKNPTLLRRVAAGGSPSAWAVAGPAMLDRLRDAEADAERPARYALVRAVLDWFRTGIAQPISVTDASSLIRIYLPGEAGLAEIADAFRWGLEPAAGLSRLTSQSLLANTPAGKDSAVTIHDYIKDADATAGESAVPDSVWRAALSEARSEDQRFAIGLAAAGQGNIAIAAEGWFAPAGRGEPVAMFNLGVLLADSDPAAARHWWQRAAEAGDTVAMFNLGALLADSDPAAARHWYERAAEAGHTDAMFNLGLLAGDSDLAQARHWWQRAAEAGHTDAMFELGLLADSDPAAARHWWQRAAEAGHTRAMFNLGALLADSDPAAARHWYERAAEAGHTDAMFNLGLLAGDSDLAQARHWWQRAAEAGDTDAMNNLAALIVASDPVQARLWYERAAESGQTDAMFNLGALLSDSDPAAARHWWQRAAEAGHTRAMFNLGLMLEESDPAAARHWWQRAADAGHTRAMLNLGLLPLDNTDPGTNR